METPQSSKLAEALAKAQGQFRTPTLNRTATIKNAQGAILYTTSYADVQECIDCIKKPLSENGLSFIQTVEMYNPGSTAPDIAKSFWILKLRLLHSSGEHIDSIMPLNMTLSPQQIGGAMTYFKRYQLSAFFGLAADFDEDGNAADGKDKVFESHSKSSSQSQGAAQPPIDPKKSTIPPKNNPPMQKALDKAPPKPPNMAPGATNEEPSDLDKALGPAMTLLEKIYAITEERGMPELEIKSMITRCIGSAKKSTSWTPEEQEKIYKYLTVLTHSPG